MRKFCFNMIEIILAISIITIAISSVMLVFTSGMRVGNNVVASYNLPDVSESILSYLRTEISKKFAESNWNDLSDIATLYSVEGWGKTKFDDFNVEGNKSKAIIKGTSGKYLYRQLSEVNGEYFSTFSAIAEVRVIDTGIENITVADPKDVNTKIEFDGTGLSTADCSGGDAWGKSRKVFEVRISYPAELPPEEREGTKIYRLEVFNEKYSLFACEKPEL